MRRVGIIVGLLSFALAGAAAAAPIKGVVRDVDARTRVIVLEDGRQVPLDDRSVILVDNRPVQSAAVEPGTTVMVVSDTRTARSSTVPPARPRTGETVLIPGTIARVDSRTNTLVLQDGREVRLDDRSVILLDGRSVPVATLTPGTQVVVTSEPLMVQESALPRAAVEPTPVSGTLTRIDSGPRTIVLSNGQVIEMRPDTVVLVRQEEAPNGTAVVRRGEAAFDPARVDPWPSSVPESEMMLEPQAP